RGGMEFGARGAVVEHAPGGTARIKRVEDDIALRLVEGLDEGPCEVEYDRAFAPVADLGDELGKGHGLAGAGGPDQHRVALLAPPRPAYPGEMCRSVEPSFA